MAASPPAIRILSQHTFGTHVDGIPEGTALAFGPDGADGMPEHEYLVRVPLSPESQAPSLENGAREMLGAAFPPKVMAVLAKAEEYGWESSHHSFAIRLSHPDAPLARPFFLTWDLVRAEGRKPSWRFSMAFAKNGQALNLSDALEYLADPAVIWPEPPEDEEIDDSDKPPWRQREAAEQRRRAREG